MRPNKHLMPLGIALLIVVAFASLFAISFHDPEPHDLPIAIAGPPAVVERIDAELTQRAPGAFDLRPVAHSRAAQAAVRDREADGAFVLGADGAQLFVASAAGAGTAATLEAVFGGVAQGAGERLTVTDLAPFDEDDSQGLMPFFLVLAVTIAAMVFRIVAFVLHRTLGDPRDRRGVRDELAQLVGFGALASVAIAVVFALGGIFEDDLWALSGLAGLLGLAVAGTVAVVQRTLSFPGIGVSVLLVILGIAASGGPLDQRYLPGFMHALADTTPVGSAVTAVRNTVYFDGAATGEPVLVLGAWALGALALFAALGLWQSRQRVAPAVQPATT